MMLDALAASLRHSMGVRHKLDIQPVRDLLCSGSPSFVPVGDDCAAIPDRDEFLLLAIEGMLTSFVEKEPWFAGYCAAMVNFSDVAAMGGRAIAIVDAIWTRDSEKAQPIWAGMTAAAEKYGVAIVGGHTNARSGNSDQLAVAVLGRARKLLTSFDARPGDTLVAAIDLRGEWFGDYPYWNASTAAPGDRLRGDMECLPAIAERGLCAAAKDISMGGIIGTAVMLAECSGIGLRIDLTALPAPPMTPLEKWLTAFPSFGYLLAIAPEHVAETIGVFAAREIAAAPVGSCDDTRRCTLADATGTTTLFWDLNREPFIGFGVPEAERAR